MQFKTEFKIDFVSITFDCRVLQYLLKNFIYLSVKMSF